MNYLEIVAAFLTGISVWLTVKRNILAFPTGIISVILSAILYFGSKLYGDMGLQIFFGVMQIHGWWAWSAGQKSFDTRIAIRRLSPKSWVISATIIVVGTVVLGYFLDKKTDSPLPFLDAFTTVTSVVAQVLMNIRFLENWYLWLLVDVIYVPMLWSRGLPWMAALYGSFILMAILGLREWRRNLARVSKD